jgi:formate hydrogenlyase transcriptional activator
MSEDSDHAKPAASSGCQVLLGISDLLVKQPDLFELIQQSAAHLQGFLPFELIVLRLYDPNTRCLTLRAWSGSRPQTTKDEIAVDLSLTGWVWEAQENTIIDDLRKGGRFPDTREYAEHGPFRSGIIVPVTTGDRRLGTLGVAALRPETYGAEHASFLRHMADLLALAIDAEQTRRALRREQDAKETVSLVNRTLLSTLDLKLIFAQVMAMVGKTVPHEFSGLAVYDKEQNAMRNIALGAPEHSVVMEPGSSVPMRDSPAARVYREGASKRFGKDDLAAIDSAFTRRIISAGIRSLLCVPVRVGHELAGVLKVGTVRDQAFNELEQTLIEQIADQLAMSLENARAYRDIEELRNRLADEVQELESTVSTDEHFEEIIGDSPLLKQALVQARTVAPSGATALVLGETGTGKELIARAIHRMSNRRDRAFIKLNCAAIPTGLLESELFGHEKGAFTGAISQKIGRMELADKGTLFLDEVGDIPPELQPKLLRVLQDQEFERLGSSRTIHVDVRLVAATNRDLAKIVAQGHFRSDLFYRLNVFPIRLPALRDRREDVPVLVRYFVQKHARRMTKRIETIPNATMTALTRWMWPGNVRELENFLERSVILSESSVLRAPLAELEIGMVEDTRTDETLEAVEREHIARVMRECNGVMSGAKGAAALLGLKRTTLQSKLRRLGLQREDFIAFPLRSDRQRSNSR